MKDPLTCSFGDCRSLGVFVVESRWGGAGPLVARLCVAHLGKLPSCLDAIGGARLEDRAGPVGPPAANLEGRQDG